MVRHPIDLKSEDPANLVESCKPMQGETESGAHPRCPSTARLSGVVALLALVSVNQFRNGIDKLLPFERLHDRCIRTKHFRASDDIAKST